MFKVATETGHEKPEDFWTTKENEDKLMKIKIKKRRKVWAWIVLFRFGLFFVLEGEGEVFLDGMYNKKICVKRKVSVEKKQGVKGGCAQQTQRCEATTERGALHQRALNSPQASSSSSLKELFGLLEEMFWFFSIETKKKPKKKEKKG